jgi:hypothetical protein
MITISIHFVPGTPAETCAQRIARTLTPVVEEFKTTHLFPDAKSEALRAMFTVEVPAATDVPRVMQKLQKAEGVTVVHVAAHRGLS